VKTLKKKLEVAHQNLAAFLVFGLESEAVSEKPFKNEFTDNLFEYSKTNPYATYQIFALDYTVTRISCGGQVPVNQ
jgi:hypothetical protein